MNSVYLLLDLVTAGRVIDKLWVSGYYRLVTAI